MSPLTESNLTVHVPFAVAMLTIGGVFSLAIGARASKLQMICTVPLVLLIPCVGVRTVTSTSSTCQAATVVGCSLQPKSVTVCAMAIDGTNTNTRTSNRFHMGC